MRIRRRVLCSGIGVLTSIQFLLSPTSQATTTAPGKASLDEGPGISQERVSAHLAQFERIADAHGGNRASGTGGHAASIDYTEGILKRAGFRTHRQQFPFRYTETLKERLALHDGTTPSVVAAGYSPSTPKGGLERRIVAPGDGEPVPGCAADDYAGTSVRGAIALVAADGCEMDEKERVAAAAGAEAILVANTGPGELHAWLASDGRARIPVGGVSRATGVRLAREADTGRRVRLDLRSLTETRTTENLIAVSLQGDAEHTVVSGAHLDSVPEGPGINDNGVAAAVLLEAALDSARQGGAVGGNRLVFGFWGAEEFGLLGSRHYVDALSAPQRERTELYLNLEMIGSPNPGLFTLDPHATDPVSGQRPAPGAESIARRLTEAFAERGYASRPAPADGRSDYVPFVAAGIPTGGLYGGSFETKTREQAALWGGTAGAPFDPCYHLPCDRTRQYSPKAAALHADAFRQVLRHYTRHPLSAPDSGSAAVPGATSGRDADGSRG
ncbi:M28 family peptidase [Streptomyces sp. PU-14G]|uniref:M28 family peptidase n=1 Tax=Streptomyces sp. PU-14G TaxID=2800808 RepID=UPI0034DE42BC